MRSLLVIFALFAGVALARVPLKFRDSSIRISDSGEDVQQQYPLTSREYLERVFGRHPEGMVNVVETRRISAASRPEKVLDLLEYLELYEAKRIAERINLGDIIIENCEYKCSEGITLFAPSNKAILKWKAEVSAEMAESEAVLTELAKAWIVRSPIRRFVNDDLLPTLNRDVKLRSNIFYRTKTAEEVKTVNGATIISPEYTTYGNVVYTIDKMIYPLPKGDIFDTLSGSDDFSVLIDLVKQAGLQNFLEETDPLTIMAPINKAFDFLPAAAMADLRANKTKLVTLLKYHVFPQTYYTARLVNDKIANLVGGDFAVDYDEDKEKFIIAKSASQPAMLAQIINPDIPANNGVIQVIDKVLPVQLGQERRRTWFM